MRFGKKLFKSCTLWVFCFCAFLFALNEFQFYTLKKKVGELSLSIGLTPVQRELFFDYPQAMASLNQVIVKYDLRSMEDFSKMQRAGQRSFRIAEQIPMWTGLIPEVTRWIHTGDFDDKAPLFEKIRQGEVWRLFTPSLLHKDIFHLLFNMAWLFLLGIQIEKRLLKCRFLILILLIGIISNLAQYLLGGPYFLGFSGVVVGMTGFIWVRQKKAPNEGYPLPKATALFVFYFVLVMMGLEAVGVLTQTVFSIVIPINIANTAHVAGGMVGLVLGRCSFFSRRLK